MQHFKSDLAPAYTWPQINNTLKILNFGNFAGVSYDERELTYNLMNNVSTLKTDTKLITLSPIVQIFPGTRPYEPDTLNLRDLKAEQAYIREMVNSSLDFYPEFGISDELLTQSIAESLRVQSRTATNDHLTGNLVAFGEFEPVKDDLCKFIAFPMGVIGNELNISIIDSEKKQHNERFNLKLQKIIPTGVPITKFKTPILQIESSFAETIHPGAWSSGFINPSIVAVRTASGTTFLHLRSTTPDDAEWDSLPLLALPLANISNRDDKGQLHQQSHFTFNPSIYGEAAIVNENGGIHIWNINRAHKRKMSIVGFDYRTIREADTVSDRSFTTPMYCQYGAHPRSLMVASNLKVDLFDLRKSSQPVNLYNVETGDKIHAFQRSLAPHGYQSVLALATKVILLDHRFPNRPLLSWNHYHNRDPPCGIQMMTKNKDTMVVVWSKHEPKLSAYHFSTSAIGSVTSKSQPVSLPSFYSHPAYHRSRYPRYHFEPYKYSTNKPRIKIRYEALTEPYRRLPPLMSLRLMENEITFIQRRNMHTESQDHESDKDIQHISETGFFFSGLQLCYTGAIYSQMFYLSSDTKFSSKVLASGNRIDPEIFNFPQIIKDLELRAAQEHLIGSLPDLKYKKITLFFVDKLWEYIAREFLLHPVYEMKSDKDIKIGVSFSNWESVDQFFHQYGLENGFNCIKTFRIKDTTGKICATSYSCDYQDRTCAWGVKLFHQKSSGRIVILQLLENHNHVVYRFSSTLMRTFEDNDSSIFDKYLEVKEDQSIPPDCLGYFHLDMIFDSSHPLTLQETSKKLGRHSYVPNLRDDKFPDEKQVDQFYDNIMPSSSYGAEQDVIMPTFGDERFFADAKKILEPSCISIDCLRSYGFPFYEKEKEQNWDWTKIEQALHEAYLPSPWTVENHFPRAYTHALRLRQQAVDELLYDFTLSSQAYVKKGDEQKEMKGPLLRFTAQTEGDSAAAEAFISTMTSNWELSDDLPQFNLSIMAQAMIEEWPLNQDLNEYIYMDPGERLMKNQKGSNEKKHRDIDETFSSRKNSGEQFSNFEFTEQQNISYGSENTRETQSLASSNNEKRRTERLSALPVEEPKSKEYPEFFSQHKESLGEIEGSTKPRVLEALLRLLFPACTSGEDQGSIKQWPEDPRMFFHLSAIPAVMYKFYFRLLTTRPWVIFLMSDTSNDGITIASNLRTALSSRRSLHFLRFEVDSKFDFFRNEANNLSNVTGAYFTYAFNGGIPMKDFMDGAIRLGLADLALCLIDPGKCPFENMQVSSQI
ncbi:hypothetical protein G9A89_021986 [Geosiphon pyriformis]|nr:hypothetical protein G9A89_021986 [Geosiphon pyriformis]